MVPGRVARPSVFISHRGRDVLEGTDTKRQFVSHLKHALDQYGVEAFVDEHSLQVGDSDAWATMLAALRSSRIGIPVLHASFGNSKWCLRELAVMIGQRPFLEIKPVFLDMDGTAVIQKIQARAEGLHAHGEATDEELSEWTAALKAVLNTPGWRLDQFAG